jgi:hypothetical protein
MKANGNSKYGEETVFGSNPYWDKYFWNLVLKGITFSHV